MRIGPFLAPCARPFFALAWALFLGACASAPPGDTVPRSWASGGDSGLQGQLDSAEAALANSPKAQASLVFVGAALHSQSTAFQSDILAMQKRLATWGMPMQSILLSNPAADQAPLFAAATQANLGLVFSRVGAWSDQYPITVVVLLSSHGNVDQLAIERGGRAYAPLRTSALSAWLHRINPQAPTAVLLSACYSGSFVPALGDGSRVLLTASAADRSSFGCSPKSTNTWFIESLLDQGMRPELSWSESFKRTAKRVDAKEREMKLLPSLPQASIPAAWADMPLSDWVRGAKP